MSLAITATLMIRRTFIRMTNFVDCGRIFIISAISLEFISINYIENTKILTEINVWTR